MDRVKPAVWMALAGLFIAFALVSFLLFLFRKNSSLLKTKLKIGGIILTVSGMMFLGSCATTCYATCYQIGSYEKVPVVTELDSILTVNLNNTNRIRFNLFSDPIIQTLSYQLQDTNNGFIVSNDILPIDGTFDSTNEEFHVILPALTNGGYQLQFYMSSKTNQTTNDLISTFYFRVSNY